MQKQTEPPKEIIYVVIPPVSSDDTLLPSFFSLARIYCRIDHALGVVDIAMAMEGQHVDFDVVGSEHNLVGVEKGQQ